MAEGFWEGWGRHLFGWYGFLFTIFGTVFALILAQEYWWISVLIVIGAFAASGLFAYQRHQELKHTEQRHQQEFDRLRAEQERTAQRLQETERKLNEVPHELL